MGVEKASAMAQLSVFATYRRESGSMCNEWSRWAVDVNNPFIERPTDGDWWRAPCHNQTTLTFASTWVNWPRRRPQSVTDATTATEKSWPRNQGLLVVLSSSGFGSFSLLKKCLQANYDKNETRVRYYIITNCYDNLIIFHFQLESLSHCICRKFEHT